MSKRKLLYYTVFDPEHNYSRAYRTNQGAIGYRSFESPKTMRSAKRIAAMIGKGTVVQQVSKTLSGKYKVKEWIKR